MKKENIASIETNTSKKIISSDDDSKNKTISRSILILLLLLLLIHIGYNQPSSNEILTKEPPIESGAVDWTGHKVQDKEQGIEETLKIPGFKSMTIDANSYDVSVNLHNPESNHAFMVLRLVLSDTEELLFESEMIEPGKGFYEITLLNQLPVGIYQAQIHYEPYDLENLTRLNGAVMNFELIAE